MRLSLAVFFFLGMANGMKQHHFFSCTWEKQRNIFIKPGRYASIHNKSISNRGFLFFLRKMKKKKKKRNGKLWLLDFPWGMTGRDVKSWKSFFSAREKLVNTSCSWMGKAEVGS